ncbi:hypothetical protein ACSFA0_25340 [Variovorax sp. LT1P1]|uniref:hypothetical protein n=1 Tax=Variovorax sp. LT1P1 TaxID=3443730 RepID=UPI003F44EDE2
MPLFELTKTDFNAVQPTTLAALGIHERRDLQRILRDTFDRVRSDLLVISEEFSDWNSARRMDLLALDRDGHLVVIELKRHDGAHMELQALRYAAMVSTMTLEHAIRVYANYRFKRGEDSAISVDAAEREIRAHFADPDAVLALQQKVRIFLVAEGFNPEITTTALYLRTLNLDITCLSLTCYQVNQRVLIDVEQVIPLPEAERFQVALDVKRAETDAAEERAKKPRVLFFVSSPTIRTENLTKNRLVLELTRHAAAAGISPAAVAAAIHWRAEDFTLSAPGSVTGQAVVESHPTKTMRRWFVKDQETIRFGGATYVVSNQWGDRTEEAAGIIAAMLSPLITFGRMNTEDAVE